jgi:hypothetical protein
LQVVVETEVEEIESLRMEKATPKGNFKSLRSNEGNIAVVARSFSVSRQAIEKRITQIPAL